MNRLLLISIGFWLFSCKPAPKKTTTNTTTQEVTAPVKLTGKQIIEGLDKRHFFDLTDTADLIKTKKGFEDSYSKHNFFEGTLRDDSLVFTDNRFYFIDCEDLFEVGGLTGYLDVVKVSFEKLNLKLEYSNETSNQTDIYWSHKINLNGRQYIAYENNFNDYDWGIAFINFIEMLNDQLVKQGSNELFYPINGGNGGRMVLLTPEQFQFVQANFPNDENLPKILNEWKVIYKYN